MSLSQLNDFLVLSEIRNGFEEKNIKISKIYREENQIHIISFGDKISVCSETFNWKLNNNKMGKIIGDNIIDIAGEYEYQLSKNK